MPFPPPTHGHEEAPIGQTLEDYLVPKKSAIRTLEADRDLLIRNIHRGDRLTIELGRRPHHGAVGLVDYEGDQFLAVWHWRRGQWYLQTDDRQGRVTEDMVLVGIARALIKDQLR